ncbi:hypothetical protein [Pseudolysinimonas sp.]
MDTQELLFAAAELSLPGFERSGSPAPEISEPATVIEIMVAFKVGITPTADDLSAAFDEGLGLLSRVLTAYALATKDPVRPPARESLPVMVPMARRTVDGDDQGYPGSLGLFMVSAGSLRSTFMPEISEETWQSIATVFENDDYEFEDYVVHRLAASRALDRDGDYRASVLASATSAEALLDGLLLHLLWHEAVPPEEAASHFADLRPGVLGRSRALLAPRIGGDWSASGAGSVANWLRDTAGVRHRVIHGAHVPTRQEAQASYTAVTGLEQSLIKWLSAGKARGRYPLTVFGMLGRAGMESRGLFSKTFQQKLDAWTGVASPGRLFRRWKSSVGDQRAQDHSEVAPPTVTGASVLLCRRVDGSTYWIAYDSASGYACEIESRSGDVPRAAWESARKLLAELDDAAPSGVVSIELQDLSGGVASGPWQLPYRLIPNGQLMFDGSDAL